MEQTEPGMNWLPTMKVFNSTQIFTNTTAKATELGHNEDGIQLLVSNLG